MENIRYFVPRNRIGTNILTTPFLGSRGLQAHLRHLCLCMFTRWAYKKSLIHIHINRNQENIYLKISFYEEAQMKYNVICLNTQT